MVLLITQNYVKMCMNNCSLSLLTNVDELRASDVGIPTAMYRTIESTTVHYCTAKYPVVLCLATMQSEEEDEQWTEEREDCLEQRAQEGPACVECTVEINNRHIGTDHFVHYREVALFQKQKGIATI